MAEVITIEEIPDFIARTVDGIASGVAALRAKGIMAEMPSEVAVQAVVITKWQELEIKGGEVSESTEKQGGTTKEKQGSSSNETSTREERTTRDNENAHDQQDTTNFESTSTL
jgi:hypothetical protein